MTKKVDNKAALKRAWRMVKVKGIDKATAFDLAWKMERGEIPKVKTSNGNKVVRTVDYAVYEAIEVLTEKARLYNQMSEVKGMTMDNYLSPKQRAGYKSQYERTLNKAIILMARNNLKIVDGKYCDLDDSQVQVVFVK